MVSQGSAATSLWDIQCSCSSKFCA